MSDPHPPRPLNPRYFFRSTGRHCAKAVFTLALGAVFSLLGACSEKGSGDAHADAIREFQKGQELFVKTVATIRDADGYDKAAPALNQVVESFQHTAALMKKLSPPDEADRAKYRKMIEEGNGRTEPTGEDMMSILTIDGREQQISDWLEAFTKAGQEAGVQMARLYGAPEDAE